MARAKITNRPLTNPISVAAFVTFFQAILGLVFIWFYCETWRGFRFYLTCFALLEHNDLFPLSQSALS